MITKTHRNLITALIFMLAAVLCPKFVFASESNVELEWEGIPNAKKYDLEIKSTRKTFNFQVDEPIWAGRLSPGFFKMRVRGRDKRGVPGAWSDYQEFKVFLDTPELTSPASGSIIASNKNDIQSVTFKWNKVYAGKKYTFDIQGVDSTFRKQVELVEDQITMDLPVATKYVVKIKSANEVLTSSPEKENPTEFIVGGKKLSAPKITNPDSLFVREVKWSKPEFAQGYSYVLEKLDVRAEKYNVFDENKELRGEVMPFKKEWPGGTYRLTVRAIANYRPPSDPAVIRFNVKDGDRSEKAEELARLRESIERLSGWFGMASYLVNSVEYVNRNYDTTGTQLPFKAIGGSLRIGIGHMTKKNPWGYYLAAENSTLEVNGFGKVDYRMFEINSFFKMRPNDSGEFRQTAGLVHKELPDLSVNFSGTSRIHSTLSAVGLRYGIEYWQAITPKLGLQANGHIFPLIKGTRTTNGQPFIPSTSIQTGFLVSYRWSKNLTTLGGYAYRVDHMEYKTAPSSIFTNQQSDRNSVDLKGHYFNILLEYQL